MTISLIVAIDNKFGIGKNNQLLWHLPNDLKYFKALTTGKTIVMGRNTHESIGKPLPNRTNVVVSRNANYIAQGCVVVHSLTDAVQYAQANATNELMIIGGGQLYQQALPLCTTLYITHVDAEVQGADVFLPTIDFTQWQLVSTTPHQSDDKHQYPYTFATYIKK